MDKPMTFNEWMGALGNNALVHANCCRKAYEAGQKAQQAKVEEVQKRVETLIQKYKDEDRELKLIDEWEQSTIYGRIAIELEQALKGEACQ